MGGTTLFTRFGWTRSHSLNWESVTGEMSSTLSTISIDLPFNLNLKLGLQFRMIRTAPRWNRNLPLRNSLTIPQRLHTWIAGLGLLSWRSALEILHPVIQIVFLLVVEVPGTNGSAIHLLFASRFAPESGLESFIDILGFHSIHNWTIYYFKIGVLGL